MKPVSTQKFEAVHGHKPRGFGLWIFRAECGVTLEVTSQYVKASKVVRMMVPGQTLEVLP